MRALILISIMAVLSAAFAGCVSFKPHEPQRFYVLDGSALQTSAATMPRALTLLVAPTTVSSFYETQEIVYSRAPGTRAYYQLHAWTERPGQRMTELLVMRLDRAGSSRTIATVVSGVRGDTVLDTHLTDFYHDATDSPGNVKVTIVAELMDSTRRVFLARRSFTRTAPVATYDAPGAVRAFNSAVAVLLDDIAAWVETTAPR